MNTDQIRFDENGLVPAIAQDVRTGEVLMLAYMNRESLALTLDSGYATYFSRSRGKLWKKGETSGHLQKIVSVAYDCDGDAILLKVRQTGPACHTGQKSCFHNRLFEDGLQEADSGVLERVFSVIEHRKAHPVEGSYTNYLLEKGVEKICKKLGEESAESIIAAVKGSREELRYELSDLFYHALVLLSNQGMTPSEIWAELSSREK